MNKCTVTWHGLNHPCFASPHSQLLSLSLVTSGKWSSQTAFHPCLKNGFFPISVISDFSHFPLVSFCVEFCGPRSLLLRDDVLMYVLQLAKYHMQGEERSLWKLPSNSFACYLVVKVIMNLQFLALDHSQPRPLVTSLSTDLYKFSQGHLYKDPPTHTCFLCIFLLPHDPLGSSRCFACGLWTGLGYWIHD